MPTQDLVLLDTCMWVPFFNRPHSPVKRAGDDLLDADRAALIDLVVVILCGFHRDDQADWVASVLRGPHLADPAWDDWRLAAKLGRQLASQGHRLPLTDLCLAAVALRRDWALDSSDPHFDLIPNLKRYNPS